MDGKKTLQAEKLMAYEAPTMEKHAPVKTVQGSGDTCYYYYNAYYGTIYYECYYYYY